MPEVASPFIMRIAVASHHAGFELKVLDLGGHSATVPDDYPDFAEALGMTIRSGQAERGVLVCGSGVGVLVAANKMPGIRAAVCHDTYSAHQGVEHDDVNVLVMGSRVVGAELARAPAPSRAGCPAGGDGQFETRN